ncbi:MAG: DUF1801 domain-containing protein [Burkholderia sp.]|jgi:uncharacterized protein YdhG (YjbR/CyaY superfamily)
MVPAATTVGGYLQSLPNDRRVAMARVCSMIRRSARGVRESMRFGLAFYELDGPLFAVESHEKSLTLYIAEQDVLEEFKDKHAFINMKRSCIEFSDLNCLPLDIVEKVVRAALARRRSRKGQGVPEQAELLKLWGLSEEDAAVAPPIVRIVINRDEDEKAAAPTEGK